MSELTPPRGAGNRPTGHDGRPARNPPRAPHRYRIGTPARVRAITSRWISLVPSKIV